MHPLYKLPPTTYRRAASQEHPKRCPLDSLWDLGLPDALPPGIEELILVETAREIEQESKADSVRTREEGLDLCEIATQDPVASLWP